MTARLRKVTVEPRPKTRPTRWRLKWYFEGPQSTTVYSLAHKTAAVREITALGCDIRGDDPLVESGDLWLEEAARVKTAAKPVGTTFATAAESAIAGQALSAKPRSLAMYRAEVRRHMTEWHALDVAAITRDDVHAWLLAQAERGDRPRTITRRLFLARLTFEHAIDRGWRGDNPARKLKAPKINPRDSVHVLSAGTFAAIVAATPNPRWRDAWRVAIGTGVRINELVAIRAADVSLRDRTLSVASKTEAGDRTIPLSDATLAVLRPYVESAERPSARLFPITDEGLRSAWERARAKVPDAGVYRVHDLRHTYATWQLADSTAPHLVSRWLGHSKVSFTMDTYGHHDRVGTEHGVANIGARLAEIEALERPALRAV